MRLLMTKHFKRRYHERVKQHMPAIGLQRLGDFLKHEGIFYVSSDRDSIFAAVIGVVFVMTRSGSRYVLLTTYPADFRWQWRLEYDQLKRVDVADIVEGKL